MEEEKGRDADPSVLHSLCRNQLSGQGLGVWVIQKKKNYEIRFTLTRLSLFLSAQIGLGWSVADKKKEEEEEEERDAIGKDARRTCLIACQPFGQSIRSNKGGGGGESVHPRPDLLSFPTSAGPTLSCVQASPWSLHFSLFERKRPTRGPS